ncbi:MAG: hypothetical protein WBD20_28100 [Pirellulaceae bacterium]
MTNDSTSNKNEVLSVVQGEPYRTPAEISDDGMQGAAPRPKRIWFVLAGALMLAGGALAMFATRQADHIQNFGNTRRGPINELDIELDDVSFDDHVRDFGATRRSYPVQVPVESAEPQRQQGFQPDFDPRP